MLVSKPPVNSNSNAPLLSEALSTYLKLKGEGKDKTFIRGANRNIKYVIELLGDLPNAEADYRQALSFNPQHRGSQEGLARIERARAQQGQ